MRFSTRSLMLCALFAALMGVCSQLSIPLPMVPINLALFAALLGGALLGPKLERQPLGYTFWWACWACRYSPPLAQGRGRCLERPAGI